MPNFGAKQKMRVKATMTRVVAAVLQVSCTARSVPWGSCSCYCLAWSWPDMQKRREVPGIWRPFVPLPPPPGALHSTACYSAGASITGGTLAYLFMHNHGSSMVHKVGGAGLVLLWFYRILEESCTGVHGVLLAGLGGVIDLLAFFEMWLGLISAGQSALLFTVPSLYAIGMMPVQRRFGSVKEVAKGEFVALDMQCPNYWLIGRLSLFLYPLYNRDVCD
ncbi:hypothetical protein EDB85DRAFT_1983871 [Lactarius pseudohatsudake]|nr:hypothetical protein EDB85DRAFT_1983871 [Lactarius pseudohatsudake]